MNPQATKHDAASDEPVTISRPVAAVNNSSVTVDEDLSDEHAAVDASEEKTNDTAEVTPPPAGDGTDMPELPTEQSSPSLATKRRGQFMDVMHPSADMKSKTPTPSSPPSRRGVSLQPINTPTPATTVGAELFAASTTEHYDKEPSSVANPEIEPETNAANEWPDPVDMMEQEPVNELRPADDSADQELLANETNYLDTEPATGDAAPVSAPIDTTDPMTSPFLPDAKVEKRPLGGVPTVDGTNDTDAATDSPIDGATEAEINPALSEELQATLMTLEGHDTPGGVPSEASEEEPRPLSDEISDDAGAADMTDGTSDEAAETPSVSSETPATSMTDAVEVDQSAEPAAIAISPSLPPRMPATSPLVPEERDDSATSIFDTEDQPMKHLPKHSSGWYIILVIAGMVVIGALGGVAFYYVTNGGL